MALKDRKTSIKLGKDNDLCKFKAAREKLLKKIYI